jgi:hypothetical protein
VTLAALGQCETDVDRNNRPLSASERAAARRQALGILMRSLLLAALAAAIAWVV